MCMELLTASGWSPANSMESVLLQVRMALCNLEPQPARLDKNVVEEGKAALTAAAVAATSGKSKSGKSGWKLFFSHTKGQGSTTPTTPTPAPVKTGAAAPAKVTWMDYGIWKAIDAYERSARAHGWKIPENWRQTANGV